MTKAQIEAQSVDCNSKSSIPAMVSRYAVLVDSINAMPGDLEDSPQDAALWQECRTIDELLAQSPATSFDDVRAKVAWLRMPSNYNGGSFGAGNENVLLSLFADIERMTAN